jgi:hypothetical protein
MKRQPYAEIVDALLYKDGDVEALVCQACIAEVQRLDVEERAKEEAEILYGRPGGTLPTGTIRGVLG